jgi:hypothetical protein
MAGVHYIEEYRTAATSGLDRNERGNLKRENVLEENWIPGVGRFFGGRCARPALSIFKMVYFLGYFPHFGIGKAAI